MKNRLRYMLECFSVPRANDQPYRAKEQSRLLICMVITAAAMFLEFFGGLWTNSLALLSDAAHMFSHLFSLGISYIAILFAKKAADRIRSYGFYRAEILAALFNGFTLAIIVIWIVFDAIRRIMNPTEIATMEMLVIAVIGLIVNLTAAMILKSVSQEDLNIKSVFFHLLSDTVSSIGIIAAGITIHYTGKVWLDPLASVLIAVMILIWSLRLIKESVHILLEATPKNLSQTKIIGMIKQEIPEIQDIHHIHIWELTSGVCSLTAHISVADIRLSESDNLRKKVNQLLEKYFNITHTNLQFECHDPTEYK